MPKCDNPPLAYTSTESVKEFFNKLSNAKKPLFVIGKGNEIGFTLSPFCL